MKNSTFVKILGVMTSLCSTSVLAFEFSPKLDIHGYGTLGASMTNATQVELVSPVTKAVFWETPLIFGVGKRPTFSEDTLGGVQFIAKNNDLMLVADFFSEGAVNYNVNTPWFYLDWKPSEYWDLQMGRMRVPMYLFSEYLKVGYAFPWSRLPVEVYNYFSNVEYTGVNLQNKLPLGHGWYSRLSAGFGMSNALENPYNELTITAKNITTFEWVLAHEENARLRAAYIMASLDAIYPPDFGVAQQFLNSPCGLFNSALAPELITVNATDSPGVCTYTPAVGVPFPFPASYALMIPDGMTAHLLSTKNANSDFLTFGYDVNWNHFLSIAEWRTSHIDDKVLPSSQAWYVLVGYEWDFLLFHATYSTTHTKHNSNRIVENSISGGYINPFSLFSPPPFPMGETMQASINSLLHDFDIDQSTIDVGIRCDILPNTALKLDYRYVTADNFTNGYFSSPNGMVAPGKRISWITAVLNVVF